MASQVDLQQLLNQLSKLTSAIESSSASSGSYSVRAGRGGNSNGKTSSPSGGQGNADAIKAAEERFAKALRRNGEDIGGWTEAIRTATGITKLKGETEKQTIARIQSSNRVQNDATERVTESMFRLAKNTGLQSVAVKRANEVAFGQIDAMQRVTDKHDEMTAAASERADLDAKITANQAANARTRSVLTKKVLHDELQELQAKKAALKTQAEFDTEMKDLRDELAIMSAQISTDNTPAFQELSAATLDAIDTNKAATATVDELKAAIKELNPLINAQGNATRRMTDDSAKLSDSMQKSKSAIADAMKALGKNLIVSMGGVVDHFREQLKYNIRNSDYDGSALLGMSDGERSRLLGTNVQTFRGITGSADNEKIMKDGTLADGKKVVRELFGEVGLEGGQRYAQMARITQNSGINTRGDNAKVIEQRLMNMSAIADSLGMVKGDLVDFAESLVESGDMAVIAMKYNGLSSKAAAEAIDREIGARMINAELLGMSTKMMKDRLQYERSQQFGTMENMIHGMIGAATDIQISRQAGMNISAEDERIYNAGAQGMLKTPEERNRAAELKLRMAQFHNAQDQQFIQSGNTQGHAQMTGIRTVAQASHSNTFSQDYLVEAEGALQKRRSRLTPEEMARGGVPASYRGGALNAADPSSYDSGAILGEHDQIANKGKEVYEGVQKNPFVQVAKDVFGIALDVAQLLIQARLLTALMGATGGGAGGLAARLGITGVAAGAAGLAAVGGMYGAGKSMYQMTNGERERFNKETYGGNAHSVLGDLGQDSGRVLSNVGNALTLGYGEKLGQGIGSVLGGGNFFEGWEGKTFEERRFSPGKKLEDSQTEAKKEREKEEAKPIPVKITGPEADAIRSTSIDTSKQVGLSKAQAEYLNRANEAKAAEANVRATMEAKLQNIGATATQYQTTDI